jgi:ribonuclease H / adenosylcobalamin/alpha-ribazole phosphatase
MTDVVLIRHASTSWTGRRYCGRGDPPLSPGGRAAARSLAAALAPALGPDFLIVTSPSRRARQTADFVAAAAGIVDIEVDERWHEADIGIAEGRTFDELATLDPALARALASGATAVDWPGGETAAELEARITAAWMALVARARPAAVISHAGALRQAEALARSLPVGAVAWLEPATSVRVAVRFEQEARFGQGNSARVLPSRP